MRIVDPTFGTPGDEHVVAVASADTKPDILCVFSNSKPGANELLAGVRRRLESARAFVPIGFASKPNAASAADTATIDHLAAQYRMAVVAIGD